MTSFSQSTIQVEIMNPQDITLSSAKIQLVKGMISKHYALPEVTSLGIWKVVTWFSHSPQKKFTTNFEVKEYVLPTFEVILKPSKSFLCVDDERLTVDIEAKYTFGQKVVGNAFVVFGVMDGERNRHIPTYLQKVQIEKGAGTANLMITKTFPNITQLVGQSIYVLVRVLTESGSEMVEAERRGIQIVTSPYIIHFKKTPQFFKPGMQFDVMVYVTYPDQTPAENVDVEVKPGASIYPTSANGIVKFTINTKEGSSALEITAKTKDPQIKDEQQAVKKMTAQAYKPKNGSNNYMDIDIDAAEFKIGDQIKVYLNTGKSPGFRDQDVTYMILSKGQIIKVDRLPKLQGISKASLYLPVTNDMVPFFRFVAYYHVGSSEVVSDSVWVDVKDTCMGKLQLKVKNKDKEDSYDTGDKVSLQITGDPGAKVGLVVVDKAVNVLNKNRLTQTKIWDDIEKHDIGCTAGGGRDSMGVFTDAGLMFESNTAGGTNTRTMHEFPVPAKRQRRDESSLQFTNTLASQYSGGLEQCCTDGMRDNRLGYSCERRASYIIDGPECVKAFLHCCNEMINYKKRTKEERIVPRSDDDDDDYDYDYDDDNDDNYMDSKHIMSRSHFPESWLWEDVYLPTCNKCKTSDTTSVTKEIYLKNSITTWQILAVSLSPTLGICVAEPEELVVSKDIVIDLKMPYSAVRGEQLEIKAIIHNNSKMNWKVCVEFMETKNVCTFASKKGKYRTIVKVDKDSSKLVSYVIIPMTLGDHLIEVKASANDSVHTDGVRKTLKVVSEGVLTRLQKKVELNPAKYGEKPIVFKTDIPADRVPYTPTDMYITIFADEISQTVEQAISGSSLDHFIMQPSGCGDQNIIKMSRRLLATHYLDRTNQWEAVGMEHRNDTIKHINTGYQWQLSYRNSEGSYAFCNGGPSSIRLTANVAKVFTMARKFTDIADPVICSALEWLVRQQLPDGSFEKNSAVDIEGNDADASVTAFVLIALQEGSEICAKLISSIRKAISFLEGRIPELTNPYAVALTSYAMANAGKLNKDILMRHSTQREDGLSWTVPGQYHLSLEATAYAVLALVKAKDYDKAGEAVQWLERQQTDDGQIGTTQACIMVCRAKTEYHTQVKARQNLSLKVELSMAEESRRVRWNFKNDKHHTQSVKVDINKEFNVTARGNGTATLSVLMLYYARPVEKKSDCTFFDLTVKMVNEPETKQGAIGSYKFIVEFFYKNEKTDATMTIMDIGLPTGFDIEENDLKELSTGKERYIQKYEKNKVLSERGSLILYLNKVSHKETEKITFRMHQMLDVGLLQPAAVTIYEYYSPEKRCTKFYHPDREDGALYRLCKGDLCQCAEENCSYQKKNNPKEEERLKKACEGGMDYVYNVTVVGMDLKQESDIYDIRVDKVLKEGTDDDVEGNVRKFLARPGCREHLGLVKGKSYLIMGKSVDLPKLGGSLQYIFGEHTWVEYLPTREESQTPEHRDRYISISLLQNRLTRYGCAT